MAVDMESLQRVETMMTHRLERMAAEADGIKFNAQDFKRNVSALKEVKEMIRDGANKQPRQTITVKLEGETEGFAQ